MEGRWRADDGGSLGRNNTEPQPGTSQRMGPGTLAARRMPHAAAHDNTRSPPVQENLENPSSAAEAAAAPGARAASSSFFFGGRFTGYMEND
ncbi:hypothetical protein ANO11243_094860 [Dothideomycetidae sp. 11243]|nr:hypothetical protein ANO11243_094860 [fungal sp. No.11243]